VEGLKKKKYEQEKRKIHSQFKGGRSSKIPLRGKKGRTCSKNNRGGFSGKRESLSIIGGKELGNEKVKKGGKGVSTSNEGANQCRGRRLEYYWVQWGGGTRNGGGG